MAALFSSFILSNIASAITWQELSQDFKAQLSELGVVGSTISLINHDQLKNALYFGLADKEMLHLLQKTRYFIGPPLPKSSLILLSCNYGTDRS
ncbi:hypothetical protein JL49_00995 [Pseudoalteromonas luteoviolacea]|uniref:Uncharacterized protein n=2 Tax=Pseudoalteromonas luteoviolacea TaxID=43657 RepID=A0A166Z5S4_9GAMM|nr:hypothetical protein N482_18195 [Pseudoalteromonas luteoviolacea NCIMB 1942]KZX02245.1 hypothetical protein JL49_00995 [Pseudoalteromonas luteoviolacea]